MELIGYLCVIFILYSYWSDEALFNWANAITFIPLMLIAASHHAYPNAIISLMFGLIGVYKLWIHP